MILQVTRYDQHPSEVIWTRVLRVQMHVGLGDVTSLIYLMFAITGLEILLFSARILINFLTILASKIGWKSISILDAILLPFWLHLAPLWAPSGRLLVSFFHSQGGTLIRKTRFFRALVAFLYHVSAK